MHKMGTALPILSPISPTPLTSRFRLVRRGLGWRHRKRKERGGEAKTENRRIREKYQTIILQAPYWIHTLKRKFCPHLTPQQKIELDLNYYHPNYIPEIEDALTLVNNLIPDLTLAGSRNITQNMKEDKIIENRRVVVEVTDEEDDLDHYSDSDYVCQNYV